MMMVADWLTLFDSVLAFGATSLAVIAFTFCAFVLIYLLMIQTRRHRLWWVIGKLQLSAVCAVIVHRFQIDTWALLGICGGLACEIVGLIYLILRLRVDHYKHISGSYTP